MRPLLRFIIPGLFVLFVLTTVTAIAATNTIPPTRLGNNLVTFNINHLKPSACAGITVSSLITGPVLINGTTGKDLILGSTQIDTISDTGGDDCILGGAGDDVITGGPGNDVCIGGPGNDVFLTCETQIQ